MLRGCHINTSEDLLNQLPCVCAEKVCCNLATRRLNIGPHSCFHRILLHFASLPALDGPIVASRQRMADAETTLPSDEYAAATSHKKYREQQCEQTAAKKEQGNQAFKNGDMSAAIEAYSEAIELDFSAGDDDKVTAILYANRAAAYICLLYTSPSPRDRQKSRMPSSA